MTDVFKFSVIPGSRKSMREANCSGAFYTSSPHGALPTARREEYRSPKEARPPFHRTAPPISSPVFELSIIFIFYP